MLIFCPTKCVDFIPMNVPINDMVVYNLTSMNEKYPRVAILPPRIHCLENEFEGFLYNYIFSNDEVFFEWMDKIIMPLYLNTTVVLTMSENPLFNFVTESIESIILNRYGYVSHILNEPDDVFFLGEKMDNGGEFGILGMGNMYNDKERYTYMCQPKEDK